MQGSLDRQTETDRRRRDLLLRHYERLGAKKTVRARERLRFFSRRLAWRSAIGTAHGFKRLLDLVLAATLLLLLLPLLLLTAFWLLLEATPVVVGQTCLGRWGIFFTRWRFRSAASDKSRQPGWLKQNTLLNDALANPAPGQARLRRWLDASPQLWNVLKGDMALFGPPPLLPGEVDAYSMADRRRLAIKPGLLQCNDDSATPEALRLDVAYVQAQSLGERLSLLARAMRAVLLGRGGY